MLCSLLCSLRAFRRFRPQRAAERLLPGPDLLSVLPGLVALRYGCRRDAGARGLCVQAPAPALPCSDRTVIVLSIGGVRGCTAQCSCIACQQLSDVRFDLPAPPPACLPPYNANYSCVATGTEVAVAYADAKFTR